MADKILPLFSRKDDQDSQPETQTLPWGWSGSLYDNLLNTNLEQAYDLSTPSDLGFNLVDPSESHDNFTNSTTQLGEPADGDLLQRTPSELDHWKHKSGALNNYQGRINLNSTCAFNELTSPSSDPNEQTLLLRASCSSKELANPAPETNTTSLLRPTFSGNESEHSLEMVNDYQGETDSDTTPRISSSSDPSEQTLQSRASSSPRLANTGPNRHDIPIPMAYNEKPPWQLQQVNTGRGEGLSKKHNNASAYSSDSAISLQSFGIHGSKRKQPAPEAEPVILQTPSSTESRKRLVIEREGVRQALDTTDYLKTSSNSRSQREEHSSHLRQSPKEMPTSGDNACGCCASHLDLLADIKRGLLETVKGMQSFVDFIDEYAKDVGNHVKEVEEAQRQSIRSIRPVKSRKHETKTFDNDPTENSGGNNYSNVTTTTASAVKRRTRRLMKIKNDDRLGCSSDFKETATQQARHRKWTALDEKRLRGFKLEHMPDSWIAAKLKRTESAVLQHWNIMCQRGLV